MTIPTDRRIFEGEIANKILVRQNKNF